MSDCNAMFPFPNPLCCLFSSYESVDRVPACVDIRSQVTQTNKTQTDQAERLSVVSTIDLCRNGHCMFFVCHHFSQSRLFRSGGSRSSPCGAVFWQCLEWGAHVLQIRPIRLVILTITLHSLIGPSTASDFLCPCSIASANHGFAPSFPFPHKSKPNAGILFDGMRLSFVRKMGVIDGRFSRRKTIDQKAETSLPQGSASKPRSYPLNSTVDQSIQRDRGLRASPCPIGRIVTLNRSKSHSVSE
jgi:hypothetical protein